MRRLFLFLFALSVGPMAARAAQFSLGVRLPGEVAPLFMADREATICAGSTPCAYGVETFSGLTPQLGQGGFTTRYTSGPNRFATGTAIMGSYSPLSAVAADQYGGAGSAYYPAVLGTGSYSVDFRVQGLPGVNYIGVWISALDGANGLRLFTSDGQITAYSASMLADYIGGTAAYFGNPTRAFAGQDGAELFAYLNIYDLDTSITRVEYTNAGWSGFETSNHAVGSLSRDAAARAMGSGVFAAVATSVPEPATIALVGLGLGGAAVAQWARRRGLSARAERNQQ